MWARFCEFIYFAALLKCTLCDRKVWVPNIDLTLPINHLNDTHNCDGLVFSETNTADMFIKNLQVKRIVLPKYGTIHLMRDSVITLGVDDNEMNCVHLKPINLIDWYTPEAWSNLDSPYSSATPLSERLPCWYDDVEFPNGLNSSMDLPDVPYDLRLNRMKFGSKLIVNEGLLGYLYFPLGYKSVYFTFLDGKGCIDQTGCVCHSDTVCDIIKYNEDLPIQCTDPIKPISNCDQPMCGSIIKIKSYQPGFAIKKIRDALKKYKSDTFVSKTEENREVIIQIIMSEENFQGQSLADGKMFYDILTNDPSFFVDQVEISMSGGPTAMLTAEISNSLSIVFGSLLVALTLIGLLFLISTKKFDKFNFRITNVPTRPAFMFARYEHMPDRGDGDSIAGSIISLNRSFDNPMYEDPAPIRSISNETITTKIEDIDEGEELTEEKQTKLDPVEEDTESEVERAQNVSEEQKYDDVLLKDL
ncbi:amnion associated transmembrane protein [Rhynchophorus ferrugineus]|uniref:amnion associated transmembrane protein n=1 Tax=Rhynchophorus ferrugineus TaxID=354439 RepID=UPI003FCE4053